MSQQTEITAREQYQQEQFRIQIRLRQIATEREQLSAEETRLVRREAELTGILSVIPQQPHVDETRSTDETEE